jgi:hypothetical protein
MIYDAYLTMNKNNASEQPPRSTLPIDMKHSKDLQESNSSNRTRRKNLSIASNRQHNQRGHYHYQI